MGVLRFKASEIPEGEGRVLEDETQAFAVFNLKGKLYCMDNACPHRGGPLGEGMVEDGVVICPWHGCEFDIATGESFMNPALSTRCYPVEVHGEDAEIQY